MQFWTFTTTVVVTDSSVAGRQWSVLLALSVVPERDSLVCTLLYQLRAFLKQENRH